MKRTMNAVMACLLFAFALFAVQSSFSNPPPEKDKVIKVYEKKIENCLVTTPVSTEAITPTSVYEPDKVASKKEKVIPLNDMESFNYIKMPGKKCTNDRNKVERPPAWGRSKLSNII